MIDAHILEARIRAALPDAELVELQDLTGTRDHYAAIVVSPQFEGKTRIEQHQLVYRALGELMDGAVHALTLKTYTPAGWEKSQAGQP